MARTANKKDIPESKIRQVKWYLKRGKTKKFCCAHLGIAYNTARLNKIISDFDAFEIRLKELQKKARSTPLTKISITGIIKDYQSGSSIHSIAENLYLTDPRIKKVLIENKIPLRGRGKRKEAKVDHVTQDLNIKFKIGDKVFCKDHSCTAEIIQIRDEDYVDYLKSGHQRMVYLHNPSRADKIKKGLEVSETEGIDYEIYWVLPNGKEYKLFALKHLITTIETELEETGLEYYTIWEEGDQSCFRTVSREKLFPLGA